jgi:hypothetical protein
MTYITRLQAEQFKRITAIDIRPGTSAGIVAIRGRNAQGKSSTLDAIMAALGGKAVMPTKPVRKGEEEGAIRLELDNGSVILRRFTVDGKGDSIEITNAEGFKAPSPQRMLDSLYSSVAFDPLAFTRLDADKQFTVVRGLVTLDVDIDALEKDNQADYDERTIVNRTIKTLEAQLPALQPQGIVPDKPVDVEALQAKLTEAAEFNAGVERRKNNRDNFIAALERNKATAEVKRKDIAEHEAMLVEMRANLVEFEEHIAGQEAQIDNADPLPQPIDVADVSAQLTAATAANEAFRKKMVYDAEAKKLEAQKAESAALTAKIEERDKQRTDAISTATMPIDGLAFGDGEILFGGVPLSQASSAEQLRVSTAIGMASAPELRVMLVRDGSLLDDEGQQILADMAAEQGFQLWVEAVDTSGKVGIVLEDGAVASVDGAEPEAPEPIKSARRRKPRDTETQTSPAAGEGQEAATLPGAAASDAEGGAQSSSAPSSVFEQMVDMATEGANQEDRVNPADEKPGLIPYIETAGDDDDDDDDDDNSPGATEADHRYDDRRDSLFD